MYLHNMLCFVNSISSFLFSLILRRTPTFTLFPYTTLFRSIWARRGDDEVVRVFATPTGERVAIRTVAEHRDRGRHRRSEEHTSELQSLRHLVCRLLLEKKKKVYAQNELLADHQTESTAKIA